MIAAGRRGVRISTRGAGVSPSIRPSSNRTDGSARRGIMSRVARSSKIPAGQAWIAGAGRKARPTSLRPTRACGLVIQLGVGRVVATV
ncbi:hypothetical protein CFIICLFH_3719 [Methylobacterium goesingense]|nr:hypothetical protein CFIICLFH_3719 [Methylobacterium goesingense]